MHYSKQEKKWEDGTIWPVKMSSKENISDFLTKAAEDVKKLPKYETLYYSFRGVV